MERSPITAFSTPNSTEAAEQAQARMHKRFLKILKTVHQYTNFKENLVAK
jgi:hypothetical protein